MVVDGDNDGDIVTGDGAVLGNNNNVNNGDVIAGTGSNVTIGEGDIEDNGTTATGGSTVIQDNEGPVLNDVDASGGHGGGASASGGGGLIGIGNGGNDATGGNGGGGGIVIVDNSTSTSTVGGNQTTVGGDLGSDNASRQLDRQLGDDTRRSNTSVQTETESTVDDHSFNSGVGLGQLHGHRVAQRHRPGVAQHGRSGRLLI